MILLVYRPIASMPGLMGLGRMIGLMGLLHMYSGKLSLKVELGCISLNEYHFREENLAGVSASIGARSLAPMV